MAVVLDNTNVNKMSKLGLRRKPTYSEIIGMIDKSNEKITGKLPNRDATFFKSSPEGSFFDGSDAMEQLREEQGKLLLRQMSEILLRQNVRTAGRTFHTERMQQLPTQSPVIAQPTQPMNVDEELTQQPTPTAPSHSTQQASQLQAELEQRRSTAMKRREETAMNHRGEVFKQSKPTLAQQMLNIQPPRVAPQFIPIASPSDDDMTPAKVPTKRLSPNATIASSSSQAPQPMNTTSQPKRNEPETRVEPRGKAGRPKMFKHGTDRADGTKRDGDEPENTTSRKKSKKTNKNKEKIQKRLEAKMAKVSVEPDEEDEVEEPPMRKGSRVRQTIQKPVIPSKVGIQKIFEEYTNAKNKNIITKEEFKDFDDIFQEFKSAKGKEKTKHTNKAKDLYKRILYPKLQKKYDSEF